MIFDDNACLDETIKHVEIVFIAGGNQQNYIGYFEGKAVGVALNYLLNTKQAPTGGTSAGMAMMGRYYHPGGGLDDATALQNLMAIAMGNNFLSPSYPVTASPVARRGAAPSSTAPRW